MIILALLAQTMVLNPAVTQETIGTTICVRNWTTDIRPTRYETGAIKRRLMRQQHPHERSILFELDHTMPLALGGAPRALTNLRLQRVAGKYGAKAKDVVERNLKDKVCHGQLTLAEAQALMAKWGPK